jgi:hypothetical protein
MPLVFAVTWGGAIGWFWQIAIEHDVPEWIRIPAVYVAGFLVIRITGWWLPRAWARAVERERSEITECPEGFTERLPNGDCACLKGLGEDTHTQDPGGQR